MVYWWFADWWAYVEFHEGPRPKFVMPLWWQVVESSLGGVVAGGLLAWVCWLGWWAWSRRTDRVPATVPATPRGLVMVPKIDPKFDTAGS
jgi:hypothetical protein